MPVLLAIKTNIGRAAQKKTATPNKEALLSMCYISDSDLRLMADWCFSYWGFLNLKIEMKEWWNITSAWHAIPRWCGNTFWLILERINDYAFTYTFAAIGWENSPFILAVKDRDTAASSAENKGKEKLLACQWVHILRLQVDIWCIIVLP